MGSIKASCFLVQFGLMAAALGPFGCDGASGNGSDTDTDSDADTDSDTDTDTDTDGVVEDHWEWDGAAIPSAYTGHNGSLRIWAAAADDVAICAGNMVDGTGGILSFDGEIVEVEVNGFICEHVWGLDADRVWVLGYVDETFEPVVYSRNGGLWSKDTISGAASDCEFEAIHGASVDDVAIVGRCSGTRQAWVQGSGVQWIPGDLTVPAEEDLDRIYGVFDVPGAWVYYGLGIFVDDGVTDTAFPSYQAVWATGESTSDLLALDGNSLLEWDGSGWAATLDCPYDIPDPEYNICWRTAASGVLAGEYYLGGGRGSNAVEEPDNWRLNRWYDGVLYSILAPCGGDNPHCGIMDMSLAREDPTLFVIGSNPGTRLMWHTVPAED